MATWRPDPSFYPSARHAMEAPAEKLAYVALLSPDHSRPDAVGVVDVDSSSASFGRMINRVDMPEIGSELHHFGWNACSSCLCPYAPHAHAERRYLIVPGIHSSSVHILDIRPDPARPELVKTIDRDTIVRRTGYTSPHTTHCGPDGIYVNGLGAANGDGPGGIFVIDDRTFDVKGGWAKDRGSQYLSYDFWWHLGYDTMITSEWGTPNMVKDGLQPDLLLGGRYGHKLHVFDLRSRRHRQEIDLGRQHQMVLELRPAHNPRRAWGFVGVVISLEDLSASVFLWYREGRNGNGRATWKARKVISIPARMAAADDLPPVLKGFGAVPPLITDLNLSLDDRFLYVSCWGTGELLQYDVSDPFNPRQLGSVKLGGIVQRTAHPSSPAVPRNGGPQMVEISRDGRRVYFTNSLYSPWDAQFYPDGIGGWIAKADVAPNGGIQLDPRFLVAMEDGMRTHQVRLQGGDSSSDSFCFA
jgi:methanethiol oxidase